MPRTPPHFKARVTIQNHRKLQGVYEDDALLAMWLRCGIECVKRFADRTSDSCLISKRDLLSVAGTQPWANAQRKLRRLVGRTPLRLRCGCAGGPLGPRCGCAAVTLEFPNFAKKHMFKGGNGTLSGDYTDTDTDTDVREDTERDSGVDQDSSQEAVSNKETTVVAQGTLANPTPDARASVDQLLLSIDLKLPGQAVPEEGDDRWHRWCHEIDLLHTIGEPGGDQPFSWEDIHAVLRWLPTHQNDDFSWGLVIRSASKLRKHFSRLLAESKRVKRQPERQGGWHAAGQAIHRQIEGGDHG